MNRQPDHVVPVGLNRAMFLQENKSDGSFASERGMIYAESWESWRPC